MTAGNQPPLGLLSVLGVSLKNKVLVGITPPSCWPASSADPSLQRRPTAQGRAACGWRRRRLRRAAHLAQCDACWVRISNGGPCARTLCGAQAGGPARVRRPSPLLPTLEASAGGEARCGEVCWLGGVLACHSSVREGGNWKGIGNESEPGNAYEEDVE